MAHLQIRPAMVADAPALVEVKGQLRMPVTDDESSSGGFLLGTTLEEYEYFIAHDDVLVAVDGEAGQVVGFSVVLAHESVMSSVLWQRASQVKWTELFQRTVNAHLTSGETRSLDTRIAYFEQLAFLPRSEYRVYAKYMALAAAQRAFTRHEHLFTTIIHEPVHNHASLPFLRVAGFELAGSLDERYPGVGHIVSDIYHLGRDEFEARVRAGRFAAFVEQARRRGFADDLY
jgi:hypothetical protein